LAYRQYDAAIAYLDSALRSWREVKAKMDVGAVGGNASAEAQAREFYFESRAQVETQLNNIFQVENLFRRQLGLAVNDGRVIRPADSPLFAEYIADWELTLQEALIQRVELRRQKWVIKSLELQVDAAQNAANPQLNFVGSYQLNGFGDDLALQGTNADGITRAGYQSAYGTLFRGNLTGWTMGFQFAMPIGLRAANAQLRNLELQLVKARAGLAASELDITHELADALQRIDFAYETAQWNLDRRIGSEARVAATQAEYEAEIAGATLDLVLRATASRAVSETAFYTSIVEYNRAINDLNYRRGVVLAVNNIHMSEGLSCPDAEADAVRKAWARSYGTPAPHLKTEPPEFSSPVPYSKPELELLHHSEEAVPPVPPNPPTVPPNPPTPEPSEPPEPVLE
jgi:outer membrane protein TolC